VDRLTYSGGVALGIAGIGVSAWQSVAQGGDIGYLVISALFAMMMLMIRMQYRLANGRLRHIEDLLGRIERELIVIRERLKWVAQGD